MSFLKYFGQGATVQGLPVRGQMPLLREEEYDQLVKGFDAHIKVFDLTKPEDVEELTEIEDKIVNRQAARLHPDQTAFDQTTGSWKVLVRWADVYVEVPPHLRQLAGSTFPVRPA